MLPAHSPSPLRAPDRQAKGDGMHGSLSPRRPPYRLRAPLVLVGLVAAALVGVAGVAAAEDATFDAGPTATISGTPQVGSTLTADEGSPSPTPDSIEYQWYADGNPIDGATNETLTLAAAQAGQAISVRVTAKKTDLQDASDTSAPTSPVAPATFDVGPTATISGTPQVGSTLTADAGSPSPTPDSIEYQWYADGNPIDGATNQTLTLAAAQAGQAISVRVTAKKADLQDASDTSAPTSPVMPPPFDVGPTATISGTPQVGSTLTADGGSPSPTPDSIEYQWYADGNPIDGATNKTFVVAAAQAGKALTVRVTAKKTDLQDASDTSAPTSPIARLRTIWVSPTGDDAGDGTLAKPFQSLAAANRLLCAVTPDCSGLGNDLEIRLAPGLYPQAYTTWTYSDPDYTTRIVPAGWRQGWRYADMMAAGGYPVMDGRNTNRYGLFVTRGPHVQIQFIQFQRYTRGGFRLANCAGCLVYGNTFTKIGSYYTKSIIDIGYGGLLTQDVTGSTISANYFTEIVNSKKAGYGKEHGIYIVHSSGNVVSNNSFVNVGGDPVRVRDHADNNMVTGNYFKNAGKLGYIGDWYCLSKSPGDCTYGAEGPSWHNVFRNNTLKGYYPWHSKGARSMYCYDRKKGVCPRTRITP